MTRTTGPHPRVDPYRAFRFRLQWDGRTVAGFATMSTLKRPTQVTRHRDSADSPTTRHFPGRSKVEAVTLERGVTHDPDFAKWASAVRKSRPGPGTAAPLETLRKDLVIELRDEAGNLAQRYTLYRCWVSGFQALPDLDANANAVAIQRIKLEHEGWERDGDVTEPAEPNP